MEGLAHFFPAKNHPGGLGWEFAILPLPLDWIRHYLRQWRMQIRMLGGGGLHHKKVWWFFRTPGPAPRGENGQILNGLSVELQEAIFTSTGEESSG